MEHVDDVYFMLQKKKLSKKSISSQCNLSRKKVKHAIWFLKYENLIEQVSPLDVGSYKSRIPVYKLKNIT